MKIAWNENLRLCRERYNYSQKEIANKLNISERTLQRYEAGVNEPTISVLLELSSLYEISLDALVGNDYHSNSDPAKFERYIKEIESTCKILRCAIYDIDDITK